MTLDPALAQAQTQTPPVSGGVTPEQSVVGQPQITPPATAPPAAPPAAPAAPPPAAPPAAPAAPAQPLFVANTQDELNAKFGSTRDEGRTSLAKALGFETVEQAEAAMSSYWQFVQEGQLPKPQDKGTPAQPPATQQPAATDPKDPAQPATPATPPTAPQQPGQPTYEQLLMERNIDARALELNANPQQLANIRAIATQRLATAAPDATGQVPQATVDTTLQSIISSVPGFSAAPQTVGGYSIPVPPVQKTPDQLAAEAIAKGDTQTAIAAEMGKLANATPAMPAQQ